MPYAVISRHSVTGGVSSPSERRGLHCETHLGIINGDTGAPTPGSRMMASGAVDGPPEALSRRRAYEGLTLTCSVFEKLPASPTVTVSVTAGACAPLPPAQAWHSCRAPGRRFAPARPWRHCPA